jgi:hypothetical protein
MTAENSTEARIAELEAEIAQLRRSEDLRTGMRSLNLTVEKANEKMGAVHAAASTWSTACCIATFSSASTWCVAQGIENSDPELAEAFVLLHRRAVEVMGEDGTVDALIEQGANREVIRVTPPQ